MLEGARPGDAEPAPVPSTLLTVINSLGWGLEEGHMVVFLLVSNVIGVQPWRGKKLKTHYEWLLCMGEAVSQQIEKMLFKMAVLPFILFIRVRGEDVSGLYESHW